MGLKGRSRVLIKEMTRLTRRCALPWLRRISPERYSDADPYKVILIPTQQITRMQCRWRGPIDLPWLDAGRFGKYSSLLRRWHAGIVLEGDWDDATESIDDYHLSKIVHERFVLGKEWMDIHYVNKALRKVRNGEPAWGNRCQTTEEVFERCRYIDTLHARLKSEGYNPGRAADPKQPFTHFLVNIGRGGEIIRNNDGKHRIILSKVIGVPRLPARVLVRHREWQSIRDAIRRDRNRELIDRFQHHPDLQDVLPHTG